MRGGATQSPLKLGRAGAARTARSDTGFLWHEGGGGGWGGGATKSPLNLGRAGAARTARSDTGFFWNEAGVGGREKEIERRAPLGQRRQSGGDNSHYRVDNLPHSMREFVLPQHFAQTAANLVGIALFSRQR